MVMNFAGGVMKVSEEWRGPLERIDEYRWLIPTSYQRGMRVPGLIFADENLIRHIRMDQTPKQVANVAHLPGILRYSMAMPDIHWGYGLPIGGVAAVDLDGGVISPGGVGSDINCGVRLLRTDLVLKDVEDKIRKLIEGLFVNVPCGVGSRGKIRLSPQEERRVLVNGAGWAVKHGYGWSEDVDFTEERGRLEGADPETVSHRALERGKQQLGTLGSGNHFLEIQLVEDVYREQIANVLGIFPGQICMMIHSGSRGLGYQVCDDYLQVMDRAMMKYKIELPDRQLACAPLGSPEGEDYLAAMACAANYAWANRQCIMHWVRGTFEKVLGTSAEKLGMRLIYDVAHNIAKFEEHRVDREEKMVCVHRKGATRAFPPGHPALPEEYETIGQPVIIPGDMGTCSYVLVGAQRAMEEAFGSTCHGAGRVLSRHKAIKQTKGRAIHRELEDRGIIVRYRGKKTLREEVSEAYKNVTEVVEVVERAGISLKVAKLRPLGVVKG